MNTITPLLILRLLRPILHSGLIVLSFMWAQWLRGYTDLIPGVQLRIPVIDTTETLIFAAVSAVLFVLWWLRRKVYILKGPIHAYYEKFLSSRGVWLVTICCVAFLGFGYIRSSWLSRFVIVIAAVLFLVSWTLLDWFLNRINTRLEQSRPYSITILENNAQLYTQVSSTLDIYSMYTVDKADSLWEDFFSKESGKILLLIWEFEKQSLQSYADQARIAGIQFWHISDQLLLEDLIAKPMRLWPLMALKYSDTPLTGRRQVGKRIFDVIVSFFALLMLSPVLLLTALAIRIDSKWPVLYTQPRVGKNGAEFRFIKFRSMYTHLSVWTEFGWDDAWKLKEELMESDLNVRKWPLQKIKDDPRVTRVWRFIRKTSLDELPSLWSVLIWDMSLVWPRPHEPFEVDRYESRQKRLLSAKPGITGYAQLFGRDQIPFEEEAKLDLYYIQNRSFVLDIYILVSTVKVVLGGR